MSTLRNRLDNYFYKTVNTKTKWFNWKLGIMGGTFGGCVNYFVNNAEGVLEGLKGGANQFTYNFVMGGVNSKICEYFAKHIENDRLAIAASSLIPATVAFTANYFWHKEFGSAEPFNSSVWQIPLNTLSFYLFGKYWRAQAKKSKA